LELDQSGGGEGVDGGGDGWGGVNWRGEEVGVK